MRQFILILLLLVPLEARAYETLVGTTVWLPANNAVRHFTSTGTTTPEKYGIQDRAVVVEAELLLAKALPFYQVSGENGRKGYIFRPDLERMVENFGVYLHPPGTIPEDYEREQNQLRKSTAPIKVNVVKASLKQRGIAEGRQLFLRQPQYGLPGLSPIKIRSLTVERDGSVSLALNSSAGEIVEQFRKAEDVKGFLTTALLPAAPAWSKAVMAAIRDRKLLPGMTKEQVVASWGTPNDFNRTVMKSSTDEQWFYGTTSQLFFENDILRCWKD